MNNNAGILWKLWDESEYLKLGELICNQIPVLEQPIWFAHLLDLALSDEEKTGAIGSLLEVVTDQSKWWESREIFYSLRDETLTCEKSSPLNNRKIGVLILAENIAKVTFNSSRVGQQGFDSDAGHWIPQCLKYLIDHSNDTSRNDVLLNHLLGVKSRVIID